VHTRSHARRYVCTKENSASAQATVASAACGMNHSAIVMSDGGVYTWGAKGDGQLGHGKVASMPPRGPLIGALDPATQRIRLQDISHRNRVHSALLGDGSSPLLASAASATQAAADRPKSRGPLDAQKRFHTNQPPSYQTVVRPPAVYAEAHRPRSVMGSRPVARHGAARSAPVPVQPVPRPASALE
jgi:hypothetical protein